MSIEQILQKTEEYLQIPSVVRFETPFISHLISDFEKLGYKTNYQTGILEISNKNLNPNTPTLAAHLDRHGLIKNNQNQFEYAAFNAKTFYGLPNSTRNIFQKAAKRYLGETVLAYNPNTGEILDSGDIDYFEFDELEQKLFYDVIGIDKNLPKNTPLMLKPTSSLILNNKISGQIDNTISIAVIYQLLKSGFDGTILLSCEEEIGNSYKYITNFLNSKNNSSTSKNKIICLDTTPFDNLAEINSGVVMLRTRDEFSKFDSNLNLELEQKLKQNNIPYNFKDKLIPNSKPLGKTELGRVILNSQFSGISIQIPTTNYHSNQETTSINALENYYKTLKLSIE